MRLKIILPNVLVVLLVGLLSFFVVRRSLTTVSDPGVVRGNVEHEAQGAAAVLQIQLLRSERWLFENAGVEALRERLSTSIDDKARREKVTGALNDLKRMAGEAKGVFADAPDLVVLVGKDGKAVGRNEDTQTYVGDDLGGSYPLLVTAAKEGHTGSDLWIASKFSHKHLVSYAPIRDKDGSPLGLVAFAWSLSDGRVAKLTDGAVALVVIEGDVPKIKAKANDSMAPGFATDLEGTNKETVLRALKNSQDSTVNAELATAAAALRNVGAGDRAAIAVARKISSIESPDKILWPILAGCGLGLVFVIMAGGILGGYITEPIGRMEETLLQITTALTTGEGTNARIEIEHPELGGLATRINQLLNTVLGVEEDNTDDDGRPSVPPRASTSRRRSPSRVGRARTPTSPPSSPPSPRPPTTGASTASTSRPRRPTGSRSRASPSPCSSSASRAWSATRRPSSGARSATRSSAATARSRCSPSRSESLRRAWEPAASSARALCFLSVRGG